MPRGPRALIFDFDGVIADDEPLHLAAFQEALAAEGITLSREAYYARYLGFPGQAPPPPGRPPPGAAARGHPALARGLLPPLSRLRRPRRVQRSRDSGRSR